MKLIYLSGPMSGIENMNFPEFNRVAEELRAKGYKVISPSENEIPEYPPGYKPTTPAQRLEIWRAFMRLDIRSLVDCDTIALLEGWNMSTGARLEIAVADALGMKVVSAYTLEPIDLVVQTIVGELELVKDGEVQYE